MEALIVVDMQNDFIDGALGTKEAEAIVPNVVKKIQAVSYTHLDVYKRQDMSKAGVSFERVDYIIRGEEEAYSGQNKSVDPPAEDVQFSHVSFSYEDGQKVLSLSLIHILFIVFSISQLQQLLL